MTNPPARVYQPGSGSDAQPGPKAEGDQLDPE